MNIVKKNGDQFEVFQDDKKAGLMDIQEIGADTLEITHTEVDKEYSGHGLGEELVKAAVEYAKSNDLKIVPTCSYAKKVIDKTPEFQKVLAK